ncbi:MAG: secretin N-terminal domain-containing protein [Xanthomonadaceae bacterium]|nr:secretin N-terminal domain-containing protein [Xanthomonadaceae bacterium]
MKTLRTILAAAAITVLSAACAAPFKRVPLTEPLRPVRPPATAGSAQALVSDEQTAATALRRTATPALPSGGSAMSGADRDQVLPEFAGGPVDANIEGMALPAFINEAFGNLLGLTFQMDQALANQRDLVTLRTSSPQAPADFYQLVVQVLRTYGVNVRLEGDLVLVAPAAKGKSNEPPLVLSGRTLPEVPNSHRPMFQLVELKSARIADVNQWLRVAFKLDGLEIQDDPNRNAVVLLGKPDLVAQAVAAIKVLDRPFMRGRVSTRLEPAFVGADELARRLVDVLTAEGYGAMLHNSQGVLQGATMIVLPIAGANSVLIFAADDTLLDHAIEWAQSIDRPNPAASGQSLFYYMVKNTRAEDLAATLNGVRNAGVAAANRAAAGSAAPAAAAPGTPPAAPPGTANAVTVGSLIVDEPRNALIFQGAAAEWERMLPLLRQMDRAARQVVIEVTIAEVTLNDGVDLGFSWQRIGGNSNISSGKIGAATPIGTGTGTDTSGGSSANGLNYLINTTGVIRAQLTALAQANRLTVLSTPRLMVKSGEEASIEVGDEVPTLSSQTAASQQTGGTSNILQSIQNRKTGIILNVRPVIYSDDRVDLEVRQEVSAALPIGTDAAIQSPAISNRVISTSLTLRDGGSVLMGGLMANSQTESDNGIPGLKDIPLIGRLFKSTSRKNTKTELVVMIVPYIIESAEQADAITRAVTSQLENLAVPGVTPDQP